MNWYASYGKPLFLISPKAFSIFSLYRISECGIYNGDAFAKTINLSTRTIKRINKVLIDFDLIKIEKGFCIVNDNPQTDMNMIYEKYGVKMEDRFERIFDPSVLADIRRKNEGERIRIEKIAQEIGLTNKEVNRIKQDKMLNKRYKEALQESLYIAKDSSAQEEFLKRLEEWGERDKWVAFDVLGYFVYKFEKTYGTDFVFTTTGDPFKSKETKLAARIRDILRTKEQIQKYIDWVFDVKVSRSFNVFGIGILTHSWLINEYNFYKQKDKGKITRTTKLPESYVKWCKTNVSSLFDNHEFETYGNLNTFIGMVKNNYADKDIMIVVDKAKEMGLLLKERAK